MSGMKDQTVKKVVWMKRKGGKIMWILCPKLELSSSDF